MVERAASGWGPHLNATERAQSGWGPHGYAVDRAPSGWPHSSPAFERAQSGWPHGGAVERTQSGWPHGNAAVERAPSGWPHVSASVERVPSGWGPAEPHSQGLTPHGSVQLDLDDEGQMRRRSPALRRRSAGQPGHESASSMDEMRPFMHANRESGARVPSTRR